MGTFEDVLCKARNVAESAGKKTTDFVEVTKLKMEMADTEREISSILEGLGRLVYDGKKAGEDVSSMVDECVAKVDEQYAKLEALRAKVLEYQERRVLQGLQHDQYRRFGFLQKVRRQAGTAAQSAGRTVVTKAGVPVRTPFPFGRVWRQYVYSV